MDRIITTQTKTRSYHHCYIKRWVVLLFGLCSTIIYTGIIFSLNTPKHKPFMAVRDNSDVELTLKWTPEMDILDEKIALKDPPLVDIKKSIDVRNSMVYLQGNNTSYEVGDTVKVRIDLFDGYGNQRHRGGDQLRVRIFENILNASAAGYVFDHKNGSFTAVLRCLWAGTPDILVYIAYTREAVRALYHIRVKQPAGMTVNYKNYERGRCHPLTRTFNQSTRLCNMTSYNGNMSFYCEAPIGNSTCSFYTLNGSTRSKLPVAEAEQTLFKRGIYSIKRARETNNMLFIQSNQALVQAIPNRTFYAQHIPHGTL